MATMQTNIHHPDTHPRRPFTQEDITFLGQLQKELNTQSAMGNAQPVFWIIKGSRLVETQPDDNYDEVYIESVDGDEFHDVNDIYEALGDKDSSLCAALNWKNAAVLNARITNMKTGESCLTITYRNRDGELCEDIDIYDVDNFKETMEETNMLEDMYFQTHYLKHEDYIYPDTMFLTHAEAQNHLRKYGYNYSADAHAYAMTAQRSPQFEMLLDIIRSVQWGAIHTDN